MKTLTLKMTLNLYAVSAMFIGSLFFLASCDDENEPKDTTAPEISFTGLAANKEVWNTVAISLDANDDRGIDKIDLFVDGNLITTITEAPFDLSWDSNTVTDGSHTVKAVASDKSGNTVETEVTIVVKNILVSIDFAADQLLTGTDYTEQGYVFLSDAAGKVIASAAYSNGQHLELRSSDFNGDKFYLTEVLSKQDAVSGNFIRLWTFTDIERGKWVVLDDRESGDGTYVGEATLNFSNPASLAYYSGYSSSGDEAYADEFSTSSVIRIKKSPDKLYVVRNNEGGSPAPTYQLYSNIVTGTNAIDLSSVNQALSKVTATVPEGATYATVEIRGYLAADSYTEPYNVGSFYGDLGTLDIYYPGSAFPSYFIEHYYDTDNVSYSRTSRSEFGNFSPLQHEASFSFAGDKLTYSASGNYDMVLAGFHNTDETAYWTLMLPLGSNISLPVLQLPSFLNGLNIPAIGSPNYYSIYDFEGISNYNELKTFIRNSTYSVDEFIEDGMEYVSMEFASASSGGRAKNRVFRVGLGTEIKKAN